ncbi:hypothetical protein [Psychrobacillus sp. BM2]|uniref:hypothetical protein n=1 Tax=Psychrobacillus sp. BM2 TaxID=3400421 RepID=UPI003B02B36B
MTTNEVRQSKGYIYKITNDKNEKVFIGYNSSIPIESVISRDKSNLKNGTQKDKYLYCEMRELGFASFKYEVIMQFDCSNGKDELLKFYRIALREYDAYNGYNVPRGTRTGKQKKIKKKKLKLNMDSKSSNRMPQQEMIAKLFAS